MHKHVYLDEIYLLSSAQLLATHATCETGDVVNLVHGMSHQILRAKSSVASRTLCAIQPASCSVHYLENPTQLQVFLLEEVTPAVKFAVPWIALLAEDALALTTLDTLHVPRLVQHFHQIPLHYGFLTTPTDEWGHHLYSTCLEFVLVPQNCALLHLLEIGVPKFNYQVTCRSFLAGYQNSSFVMATKRLENFHMDRTG